jgi:hypothetical protein
LGHQSNKEKYQEADGIASRTRLKINKHKTKETEKYIYSQVYIISNSTNYDSHLKNQAMHTKE